MKICPECQQPYEPVSVVIAGRTFNFQVYCLTCGERLAAEADQKRADEDAKAMSERNAEKWRSICPIGYDDSDADRLPPAGIQAATNWHWGSKGLLFIGNSGRGKTRCMYLLMKRLFHSGRRIVSLTSGEFRRQNAKEAMAGVGDAFIDRCSEVDVFFMDDLGQMKVTASAGEALLDVIEARTRSGKPCFFTTQYSGKEFINRFEEPPMGQAIVRRIREFCEEVKL